MKRLLAACLLAAPFAAAQEPPFALTRDHVLLVTIDDLNDWIVVLSDHGWHLGEKQHVAKQTLRERSTHVPLIVVPPKRLTETPRGVRCDRPVDLIDVQPTQTDPR